MTASTVTTTTDLVEPADPPLDPKTGKPPKPAKVKLGRPVLLVLFTIIGADIMDLLDNTVMNIAGPVLQKDLGASTASLQWIVAGYTLAFAVFLTTGGRLGDIVGRRRMFLIGISGFLAGSVLCSLAQTSGQLIGFRILQGAFSAMMIPQGIGIMRQVVPPEKMTVAFGIFGPMMGLSATLGPTLGGWLVGADLFGLGWRAIFLVNVPLGLLALYGAARLLPADEKREPGTAPKLDNLGMLLATAAITLLIYPLIQGREADWAPWTFIMMAASVPVFVVFAVHQRARAAAGRDPFVVPSLFRKRSFNSGVLVMAAFSMAMSGVFFATTLFMQGGLGYSALHAGLTMIPWSVGTIISMGVGQALLPKLGPRRTLQLGMVIMAAGSVLSAVLIHRYGLGTTTWILAGPLAVSGGGMGLIFGPIFGTVIGDLDEEEVGSASGLLNAIQQLAGAFGIAFLGTLFFNKATPAHTAFSTVGFPPAATLVYLVSAGLLVVSWGLAFSMSKHAKMDEMGG